MNEIQPKRWFLGKKLSSKNLEGQLLPKFIALPIFSSDPLSSVAYGPQELLMILTLGGVSFLAFAPGIAAVVVLLLSVIILSYRKVIKAYPSGGGDYEVAMKNLGKKPALVVASALLLDYVMTVAVSIASGTDNLISAFPTLDPYRVEIAVGFIILLTVVNLRGVRESGVAFAIPTYLFILTVFVMIGAAIVKLIAGEPITAPSAQYAVHIEDAVAGTTQAAMILLLLRAFASGAAALTGVEAIANGVQAFRKPKILNAQKTLMLMGIVAILMFIGVISLALISQVHYAEFPCEQLPDWKECATAPQLSVMAQIGVAVFGPGSILFYVLQAAATAILLLAANTAFNGFPLLSSVLAKDKFAPKALMTRGDRLVYSNGMLSLMLASLVMIIVFQASVTALIQLYVLGVFTSFTIGQIGMLKHWGKLMKPKKKLTDEQNTAHRKEGISGILINGLGAVMTGSVLVIVTITKFSHGAWMVFIIMPILFLVMFYTNRYYMQVEREIKMDGETQFGAKGDYAVVLMDKLNKPQLKALDYALSSRHTHLEALHVAIDPESAKKFAAEWKKYENELGLPLRIIESPYREFSEPLIEFLQEHRKNNGSERISVYLPKLVVGHWWEHILHNHRAGRLRKQLMYLRGVMVTLVPWRLESAEYKDIFARRPLPGDARRGLVRPAPRRHGNARNTVARVRAKRIDED
ncbi:APC family permease [Rhodoluna sp.]|uniref:APC family permease n=1 Tax=Rhodoluna sp. TaxID=1969481 RepID=UPI0025F2224B|nr:APC family permease [Rhodoluna sp.]